MLQLAAQVIDQALIQAGFGRVPLEQRLQVLAQCQPLFRRQIAGQAAVPVQSNPGFDEIRVVMLRVGKHQISLQALIQKVRRTPVVQLLFQPCHQARREHGDQQLAVDAGRLGLEHVALIQAQPLRPVRRFTGQMADRVEQRQYRQYITLSGAEVLDGLAKWRDFLIHLRDVALVGVVTDQPQCADQQYHRDRCSQHSAGDPLAAALHFGVDPHQPLLGKRYGGEQSLDEITASGAGLPRQLLSIQVHALGHAADQTIDRAAFLRAAGEIHATQQRALLERIGLEDAVQKALQRLPERRELLREAINQVAPRRVTLLLQALYQPFIETLLQR
ncbi:hypothetical protein ALQ52_04424 [Pseudomonas cannabina pv. alisalensis]|nr:hypothetical protein ALQ52_04424 [Pseudomonas cannabina pv. alisalensis]